MELQQQTDSFLLALLEAVGAHQQHGKPLCVARVEIRHADGSDAQGALRASLNISACVGSDDGNLEIYADTPLDKAIDILDAVQRRVENMPGGLSCRYAAVQYQAWESISDLLRRLEHRFDR